MKFDTWRLRLFLQEMGGVPVRKALAIRTGFLKDLMSETNLKHRNKNICL